MGKQTSDSGNDTDYRNQLARNFYHRRVAVRAWRNSAQGKLIRRAKALLKERERDGWLSPAQLIYDGTGPIPANLLKAYPELAQQHCTAKPGQSAAGLTDGAQTAPDRCDKPSVTPKKRRKTPKTPDNP